MADINFPSNPTNGQTYVFAGKTWTFNATGWVPSTVSGSTGATGPAGAAVASLIPEPYNDLPLELPEDLQFALLCTDLY